ncbi:MAG: hypothetical protein CVV07_07215 [Gammaproteobacteria bacterium HGW-Gammaproteobacteria-11]|nr:MAG: hypothetical protein CVV07_07215 [Gammaproteobacteria bacterium HGW-Gammaproteobacteria-11]
MTRRKHHNAQKRSQAEATAILRDIGILFHSAMADKEVRVVNIKREQVCILNRYSADLIIQRHWRWTVALSIFTTARVNRMEIIQYNTPCLQAELVEALEEDHQTLLAKVKIELALEGKGEEVHSFGWIAMPVTTDLELDKAERLYATALATIKPHQEAA